MAASLTIMRDRESIPFPCASYLSFLSLPVRNLTPIIYNLLTSLTLSCMCTSFRIANSYACEKQIYHLSRVSPELLSRSASQWPHTGFQGCSGSSPLPPPAGVCGTFVLGSSVLRLPPSASILTFPSIPAGFCLSLVFKQWSSLCGDPFFLFFKFLILVS